MNIRVRHEAIIRSLRRNGTLTVSELAAQVGASRRTVLRDLSALRDEGYVIHSEPGRGGGGAIGLTFRANDRKVVG